MRCYCVVIFESRFRRHAAETASQERWRLLQATTPPARAEDAGAKQRRDRLLPAVKRHARGKRIEIDFLEPRPSHPYPAAQGEEEMSGLSLARSLMHSRRSGRPDDGFISSSDIESFLRPSRKLRRGHRLSSTRIGVSFGHVLDQGL